MNPSDDRKRSEARSVARRAGPATLAGAILLLLGGSAFGQVSQIPGGGTDVAIGPEGSVYVIGTAPCDGNGCAPYKWDGSNFQPVAGRGVRITVDAQGRLWLVNRNGGIYRYRSATSQDSDQIPGFATDIGAGADGSVFIIGNTLCDTNGCAPERFNGNGFTPFAGRGVRISAGPNGLPTLVNKNMGIYRYDNQQSSTQLPGAASEVSVAPDGTIYVVGTTGCGANGCDLYKYNGSGFDFVPGIQGESISVGRNGEIWTVGTTGNIFRGAAPAPFTLTSATTTSPAVGGQEFEITVTGTGFNPDTARIFFSSLDQGTLCPTTLSGNCTITNQVLTFKSTTQLRGRYTLAAGSYFVFVAINNVFPSNSVNLTVGSGVPTGLPAWSITKTHLGNFTPGSTGTYTITVSNAGRGATVAGPIAQVFDNLPTGLTAVSVVGQGWFCTTGPPVGCNRSDSLTAGASYPPLFLTVNVATNAPSSVINTASVQGGGVSGSPVSASDPTTIGSPGGGVPALSITKTHVGNFTQGQTGTYTITVTNLGTAATTTGPIAQVVDTLPTGLTVSSVQGQGWLCTTGPPVGCNRGDSLATGASYPPLFLTVNVAANAPASVINTVSLLGAGNALANDPTTIVPAGGSLSISGTISDARGTCSSGVNLTATGGNATQSRADGTYTFSNLLPGSYTITPTKAACTFAPPSITLNLQSSATGINFTGGGGVGITIAPSTLRPATLGAPYSALLTATGGTAPHTFTVVAGNLPAGISLATNGALSGTPSQLLPFPSTFTVQARDANGANGQLAYTLDVVAASNTTITGIRSASDFGGGFAFFASGSWIEIAGTGLATSTRTWGGADFTGGGLVAPTVLDNVRVFINNQPAFVYFVSPTQLNVQAPADAASGPVEVRVTNSLGIVSFASQKRLNAPGMLAPSAFNVGGRQYLAAQFPDRFFVGRTNLIQGAAFRPAKPGDQITLYGIGFGEVSPGGAPGNVVTVANSVVSPVAISFGQTPATVSYSGLAPGFLGLYQFNVAVPEVPDGDSQINITLGGQPLLQPAMFLTVQRQ